MGLSRRTLLRAGAGAAIFNAVPWDAIAAP